MLKNACTQLDRVLASNQGVGSSNLPGRANTGDKNHIRNLFFDFVLNCFLF